MTSRWSALALGLFLVAVSGPVQAQMLPMLADESGDTTEFWWSASRPRTTAFDATLLEALGDDALDPAADAGAPAISQVYRAADLGDASARNLGGLFGATSVLLGSLSRRSLGTVTGELFWIAEVELRARWLEVDDEVEHAAFSLSAVGQGTDAESALEAARNALAAALAQELRRRQAAAPVLGVHDAEGPVLVVRHLSEATALVALLGELRARDAVVADLAEAWASEGALAYSVELVPGAPLSAWTAVLEELALDPTWPYELFVLRREGLTIEVAVEERLPAEPEPTPATPETTTP